MKTTNSSVYQILTRNNHPACHDYPFLAELNALLPSLPLDARKALMTCLRVGSHPKDNLRLRHGIRGFLKSSYPIYDNAGEYRYTISASTIIQVVSPLLKTPLKRSILSIYLRGVPLMDDSDWRLSLQTAKRKEIQASQQHRTYEFEFPFYDGIDACLTRAIHPDIPFRPDTSLWIRQRLIKWRFQLEGQVLVPQVSLKTIGEHSSVALSDELYHYLPSWERHRQAYTTSDLESFYMETGREVVGPCEVRYAWKYNDLKPRIYYAIGSSCYFAAKYVWKVFDSLQRVFHSTDPNTRFSFHRFPMVSEEMVFMIYDYASFTSALSEFFHFVAHTAHFLRGTSVLIYDTHEGLKKVSLYDLLSRYNSVCNQDGEFSVHRIDNLGVGDRVIVNHQTAGMLGVFGNITGSTALHGLIGISICGSEDMINAIGDDAGTLFDVEKIGVEEIKAAIKTLGDIADEKFEFWVDTEENMDCEDGWHFTKRPIAVRDRVITQSWMPDFPIIPTILGYHDGQHTPPVQDLRSRRRLLIKQTCRLFDSMRLNIASVDDDDIDLCLTILRRLYAKVSLPVYGGWPDRYVRESKDGPYLDQLLAVPKLHVDSIREGWIAVLREQYQTGIIRLPRTDVGDSVLPSEMYQGLEFNWHSDKVLNVLAKIGVLSKEPLYEDHLITDENLELFERVALGKVKVTYQYVCRRDYPPWTSYFLHVQADTS